MSRERARGGLAARSRLARVQCEGGVVTSDPSSSEIDRERYRGPQLVLMLAAVALAVACAARRARGGHSAVSSVACGPWPLCAPRARALVRHTCSSAVR